MFEIGKRYQITTGLGEYEGHSSYEVIAFEAPLLKVRGAGQETIFNTASASFIRAEKEFSEEEKLALLADLPAHLIPRPAPLR